MKHSDIEHTSRRAYLWSGILLWLLPLTLIVPNAALGFTEFLYTPWDRLANFFLPLGVYMLLAGCWKRTGLLSLLSLPLMILCAFQIVLLYLYGESIIAIDMFLNVVTTNFTEATSLLNNLIPSIVCVCLLYLPPLTLGIILTRNKWYASRGQRRPMLIAGAVAAAAGIVFFGMAYGIDRDYRPERKLFPVNVICNMFKAAERTEQTRRYTETSAGFRFDARATRPDSAEVYVLVIGETSRADNWQLAGYERPTNPRLSRRNGITFFDKVLSESNTTHKSVPLLMSHISSEEFGDSLTRVKGIIDAFKEAGFRTAWISNQQHNGSYIDFFGEQADSVHFLVDDGRLHLDTDVVPVLRQFLNDNSGQPTFIAIHTYGSHFVYRDRYPREDAFFTPENKTQAEKSNRDQLTNAYDNTIRYTDLVLDSIIGAVEATGRPAGLLYLSDHGEDIFDDSRGRFLHASPNPTYWQIHIPLLVWTSDEFRSRYPELQRRLEEHRHLNISSGRSVFHTLADMAGLTMPMLDRSSSLASESFREPVRRYLNDYNESVPLGESGLRTVDIEKFNSMNISVE